MPVDPQSTGQLKEQCMKFWANVKKVTLGGMFVGAMMLASSLTVTGCLTNDGKDSTATTPTAKDTDLVAKSSVTLGAQSATPGSSLDLDTWTAYGITAAKAVSTKIDLIFAYSTATTSAAIYSPNIAVNGATGTDGFDFLAGFANPRTTVLKRTTAAYADVMNRRQLDSVWAAATVESDGKLDVAENMVFLAQSDMGKIVIMQVGNLVTGATGTVSLTAKAKAFD
jgi:hypothetical protein